MKDTLITLYLERYDTIVVGFTHFSYFEDTLPDQIKIISRSIGSAKNVIGYSNRRKKDNSRETIYFHTGKKVVDQDILANYNQLYRKLDEIQK